MKELKRDSRSLASPVVALSLGWVMIYADRLSISPLLNIIRGEFGLTFAEVSLVVSIYFLTYVSFTIPATIAAGRFGYKKVMILFFLLASVSLGLAGLLGYSYFLLLLLIALHGVGAGAYYPAAYTISSDIVPKEKRGFASSAINSGMGFGSILGLIVAGPVLSYFSSWQWVLVLLSIPSGLVCVLLLKLVPSVRQYVAASSLHTTSGGTILEGYSLAIRKRQFVVISGMMFCSLYGYWVILTWAPSLLQTTRGLGIFFSGAVTAIFAAVAIPSSVLISRHSDKIGRRRIALVILPLASITLFMMAYSSNLWEFVGSIIAYGIVGKLTLDPIVLAWISDVMPSETIAASLSMLNVSAMSSSILAPIITGIAADLSGTLTTGFYLGSGIVLVGFFFAAYAGTSQPATRRKQTV